MPYSSYDHDKLEAAETMRIERRIYFEAKDREIAPYASLPIAQLLSMRSESAAAEQAIFDDLKERAAAWEEQAGRTLLLDKTLEYVRTPHVQHTANEWQTTEHNRHIRSNRVYQMNYYIYENTRYDKEAQKSIPYSWTLTWSVRTNSPSRTQAKIAGQDRKVFTDKAAMEKYLNCHTKSPLPYNMPHSPHNCLRPYNRFRILSHHTKDLLYHPEKAFSHLHQHNIHQLQYSFP